ADPQVLEVQRGGYAVHAHVGDVASWANERRAQLEGSRHAHRFHGDVGAEPFGQRPHDLQRVLLGAVDGDVGSEAHGGFQATVGDVDGDDGGRVEELGACDRCQADGAAADY